MMKIIIPLLIISIGLMGCPEHTCQPNYIKLVFIGFAPADIDTIVLRAYKRRDSFHHLVDTVLITDRHTAIIQPRMILLLWTLIQAILITLSTEIIIGKFISLQSTGRFLYQIS
jgi:hypothetical protein